jgi:quercetin dioxygenase-like cupin family protein
MRHPKSTHANPTPATDGKHLVVFFGSEELFTYDLHGKLLWKKNFGVLDSGFYMVPSAQWGFASSPVIYFHSPSMTFAHYDFKRGASIHEHFHPQEEVYEVIEGELDLTIDGVTQIARAGLVAIVPANALHSVKALTDGRVIIVDYPARHDFD